LNRRKGGRKGGREEGRRRGGGEEGRREDEGRKGKAENPQRFIKQWLRTGFLKTRKYKLMQTVSGQSREGPAALKAGPLPAFFTLSTAPVTFPRQVERAGTANADAADWRGRHQEMMQIENNTQPYFKVQQIPSLTNRIPCGNWKP
jgi:hypothetical protein